MLKSWDAFVGIFFDSFARNPSTVHLEKVTRSSTTALQLQYSATADHFIKIREKAWPILQRYSKRKRCERSPWAPTYEERDEKLYAVGRRIRAMSSVELGQKSFQNSWKHPGKRSDILPTKSWKER